MFVHGWAMNSAVWEPLADCLSASVEVSLVDLPGHGDSDQAALDVDNMVDTLAESVDRPAIWVGWSLGGQLLLRLRARYPERVSGLLLVASTPCFVQRADWRFGVERAVFTDFARALQVDRVKTLRRFLGMQVVGVRDARQRVRAVQQALSKRGEVSMEALQVGLDILLHEDFRADLAAGDCPVGWLLGQCDTLVPASLAEALRAAFPRQQVTVVAGAGHGVFLSHPQAFVAALERLLDAVEDGKACGNGPVCMSGSS